MIIVEGPDASGKTTLVKQLSADLGVGTIKSGGPFETGQDLVRRISELMQINEEYDNLMICDRYPVFSEIIYQPIVRPDDQKLPGKDVNITLRLKSFFQHHMVILCMPPKHVYLSNLRGSDQPKWVRNNDLAIYEGYKDFKHSVWLNTTAASVQGRFFVYDYTDLWSYAALQYLCKQYFKEMNSEH